MNDNCYSSAQKMAAILQEKCVKKLPPHSLCLTNLNLTLCRIFVTEFVSIDTCHLGRSAGCCFKEKLFFFFNYC